MSNLPGEGFQSVGPLSEGLEQHVDLALNASRYPELSWQLTDNESLQLNRIRAHLLEVPLVHSTNRSEEEMRTSGILPWSKRPKGFYGNSHSLDESLGLTEYVFMHWAAIEKSSYGRNHVLIDPKILFDPNTVVTPKDISAVHFGEKSFESLEPAKQQNIQKQYFEKMVGGVDWLEIVARRILRYSQSALGAGPVISVRDLFVLTNQDTLGEIKYHGVVSPEHFTGYLKPANEPTYWAHLIENGLLPGPVYRAYPTHGNDYDMQAEELGATLDAAHAFWQRLLAEAME